jgi:hypothetical protein
MNKKNVGYWLVTASLAIELLTGGIWDVARTHYVVGVVTQLGYPEYVLTILGIWKLLAVPALLLPGFPRLKEWTYAGVIFEMTGAAASHAACGDAKATIAPLVIAAFGVASWTLRPPSRLYGSALRAEGQA